MRLTTKGRFAVTAMIDLSMRQHQGPVTLAGISQRQKISLSYLEQLFGGNMTHALIAYNWGPGNMQAVLQRQKTGVPRGSHPVSCALYRRPRRNCIAGSRSHLHRLRSRGSDQG